MTDTRRTDPSTFSLWPGVALLALSMAACSGDPAAPVRSEPSFPPAPSGEERPSGPAASASARPADTEEADRPALAFSFCGGRATLAASLVPATPADVEYFEDYVGPGGPPSGELDAARVVELTLTLEEVRASLPARPFLLDVEHTDLDSCLTSSSSAHRDPERV